MKIIHTADRFEERERRYPILTTLDLTLHWLLCLGVFLASIALVWVIVSNTSPQLVAHLMTWLSRWRG